MKFFQYNKPEDYHFTVRSRSTEDACAIVAAVATAILTEGLKSLALRHKAGLPPPNIAGRPLDGFLNISLTDESELLAVSAVLGRRTGIGTYWLAKDLSGAPEHLRIDDADAIRACRALLFDTTTDTPRETSDD